MRRVFFRPGIVGILALLPLAGCATRLQEPANLDLHKAEIRRYVMSGGYESDLKLVAAKAKTWIEQRAAGRKDNERLAVVFDLDETLFLNWQRISESGFTYVHADWDKWVAAAAAPAIEPVREVYQLTRENNVEVIFLTGRHERHRGGTEVNLRRIGCEAYAALICRPDDSKSLATAFKAAERRRLTQEGIVIIANIGDQFSDLEGGFAERVFKLPNPFYWTE